MNIKTEINEKENIRIHTLTGEFDFDSLFQHLEDIYNDPNFDPALNSVWDLTKVEGIQKINSDLLERIVAYVNRKRSKHGKMRTVIVVSKKVDFGIARMYEQKLEATGMSEISVFKDLNNALAWIKT
jgi:hypothetical protein